MTKINSNIKKAMTKCNLCVNGVNGLLHPLLKVNGLTCAAHATNMASYKPQDAKCLRDISLYRGPCCTNSSPPQVSSPSSTSSTPLKDGPYKICDVCTTGKVPTVPMVLNMLYIGVGTCHQYWEYGQRGLIPNHLCSTLQHFAFDPCECQVLN